MPSLDSLMLSSSFFSVKKFLSRDAIFESEVICGTGLVVLRWALIGIACCGVRVMVVWGDGSFLGSSSSTGDGLSFLSGRAVGKDQDEGGSCTIINIMLMIELTFYFGSVHPHESASKR